MLAHSISNRLTALQDFFLHLAGRLENQSRMGESVVSDDMPSPDQFASNVGPLFYIAADEEECGPHPTLGQDLQQTESVRIIRAVVVGERELLCSSL